MPDDSSTSTATLLESLFTTEQSTANMRLAKLDPPALEHLQAKASGLQHRALGTARDLLDLALDLLEQSASLSRQRLLLERADDELESAQRWGELAANARFCREHPELALQLAGDAPPDDEALGRAAATTSKPVPRHAKR